MADLRDMILFARDVKNGYDEDTQADVSEAMTMLLAKSFCIRPGIGTLRVFTMIQGFRAVPATVGEILDTLNA